MGFLALALSACARSGFATRESAGNPGNSQPLVSRFVVTNGTPGPNLGTRTYAAGDTLAIEWTVSDVEGLHPTRPLDLYMTTDNRDWSAVGQGCCATGGRPKAYAGSFSGLVAPSASYFRLKLVARDMAGETSFPALSDAQNTGRWNTYAGSADSGANGSARATALRYEGETSATFAVDPSSGDLYALDLRSGVLRLDAASGAVSVALHVDTETNLPSDGPLPSRPTVQSNSVLQFDSDGLLYVLSASLENYDLSHTIYQIDLANRYVRAYLGGGGPLRR